MLLASNNRADKDKTDNLSGPRSGAASVLESERITKICGEVVLRC